MEARSATGEKLLFRRTEFIDLSTGLPVCVLTVTAPGRSSTVQLLGACLLSTLAATTWLLVSCLKWFCSTKQSLLAHRLDSIDSFRKCGSVYNLAVSVIVCSAPHQRYQYIVCQSRDIVLSVFIRDCSGCSWCWCSCQQGEVGRDHTDTLHPTLPHTRCHYSWSHHHGNVIYVLWIIKPLILHSTE